MNASYEQEPFSYGELAIGSIAMAAVALVAFLAVESVSRPLNPGPSTSPSNTAQPPETGPPSKPSDKAGKRHRHAPTPRVSVVSQTPDQAVENPPAPSLAQPKETPADFPFETASAAMVKPQVPAISATPAPLMGPFDLQGMRNDFAAWSSKPEGEIPMPVPRGAKRDPSSRSDALWIQTKLRDLGYYAGNLNGVWGPASRSALRDFKTMNGLPADDKWDRETEQGLLSKQSVHASSTFIGNWAQSIEGCQTGGGAPLVIRPRGAKSDGGKCDFNSVKRETATTWRIQADCSVEEWMWRANISLKLTASSLNWTSERGADTYVRCPTP
jgi:hypothetical protein